MNVPPLIACASCGAPIPPNVALCPTCGAVQAQFSHGSQRVTVTNFDMPFRSMVRLMLKIAFAAIPAGIVLMVFWVLIIGLVGVVDRLVHAH